MSLCYLISTIHTAKTEDHIKKWGFLQLNVVSILMSIHCYHRQVYSAYLLAVLWYRVLKNFTELSFSYSDHVMQSVSGMTFLSMAVGGG